LDEDQQFLELVRQRLLFLHNLLTLLPVSRASGTSSPSVGQLFMPHRETWDWPAAVTAAWAKQMQS